MTALSGLICGPTLPAAAQTTSSFAYQGRLLTNGQPVNGTCTLQFDLYDAASAGTKLNTQAQVINDLTINDGYFKTNLDFGLTPFTGAVRYLDVSVKCASETAFTSIGRQPLAAAPQALVAQAAQTWAGLTSLPANLTFLNSPTTCTSGQVAKWNGTTWACGDITVGTDTLAKLTCTSDQVVKWNGTAWGCAADTDTTYTAGTGVTLTSGAFSVNTSYWGLTGNAGTAVGTNFIGTTDNQALEFKVNGQRVLSLAPGGTGTEIPNIIGGFSGNTIASGVKGATIGGGGEVSSPNSITTNYATICGGTNNTASGENATVAGGGNSTASGMNATVGGGDTNNATGNFSFIGGGYHNTASGGDSPTVGGGSTNTASGSGAAVGGGMLNVASGLNATVSGGRENAAAGDYSFAAGYKAKVGATHAGTFLWADSTGTNFASATANEFAVRASGGVRFITNAGAGATLAAGSGTWASLSDRNAKANFMPVDSQAVLQKVVALPLSTWNYKAQEVKIRHMGPMAQDLYQAFGLGENEKQISTIDADGIALAAIQGLAQQAKIQQAQIKAQQEEIGLLKARLMTLEVLLKQK